MCRNDPFDTDGAANTAVDAHILYGNASSLNMPSVEHEGRIAFPHESQQVQALRAVS